MAILTQETMTPKELSTESTENDMWLWQSFSLNGISLTYRQKKVEFVFTFNEIKITSKIGEYVYKYNRLNSCTLFCLRIIIKRCVSIKLMCLFICLYMRQSRTVLSSKTTKRREKNFSHILNDVNNVLAHKIVRTVKTLDEKEKEWRELIEWCVSVSAKPEKCSVFKCWHLFRRNWNSGNTKRRVWNALCFHREMCAVLCVCECVIIRHSYVT